MTATARRYPEGALVYVIDQTDLYLRVRDGVRQVHVGTLSDSSFSIEMKLHFLHIP